MQESQYNGIIKKYGSIEYYKECLHKKLSKHFYTNGVIDKKFYEGEDIPEGFRPGRTNGITNTRGSKWITNGTEEHLFYGDVPPKGYHFGKLSQTKEHKQKISESLKGKKRSKSHCKHLSESHLTESYKEKIKLTNLKRYGVENPFQADFVKEKCNTTEVCNKRFDTMRKNKTFNSSKREDFLYTILLTHFDKEDIVRQYKDFRYPFYCDFYIKSLDLFIELNAHWSHNKEPFNCKDVNHLKILEEWKQKSINSKYYKIAIDVWTRRDVNKIKSLIDNNLKYILIYDMNFTNIISNLEVEQWQKILK